MEYDVIIIGSGAGGGTLARELASSGKKILILERGDWLPRESENWNVGSVFVDGRYISEDKWYDSKGKAFQPQVHYYVGGATKLYGAALYRLRKEDFEEMKHHDGLSPAWPITYDELEPYYTRAEELYQVHGERGRDPTEPHSSKPYPYPPVSNEPRIQAIYDGLEKEGYKPFAAPCAVMLDEKNPAYSKCIRCSTCDGFPCLVHAKGDAETIGVRPALEKANVTLRTNAHVVKIHTDESGRKATEVVLEDGETIKAAVIVVACGAANSAKLLLNSANSKHPKGLANSSDQVGRNYMFHNSQAVLALSKEPNPTKFQKTLALNDFYFGMDGFEFPMGNIQMIGKSQGEMFKGEKPIETLLVPTMALDKIAEHAVDFWLSTEDLPDPENRVTVNKEGEVILSYTPNNQVPKQKLYEKLKSLLEHMGMEKEHLLPRNAYLKTDIPLAGVAHQVGTCRFGSDPKSSVLDPNCKAHDLDNLFVADASFFPSIGAVNPSLTIMAVSLRLAEHLKTTT